MRNILRLILALAAIGLIAYPFWGIFSPETYVSEIIEHHPYAEGYELAQVSAAAVWLWLPNTVLATSFVLIAVFIANLTKATYLKAAAILIVLYPFVRTGAETMIGVRMTEHVEGATSLIHFSSDKMLLALFGLIILGVVTEASKHNDGFKTDAVSGAV